MIVMKAVDFRIDQVVLAAIFIAWEESMPDSSPKGEECFSLLEGSLIVLLDW